MQAMLDNDSTQPHLDDRALQAKIDEMFRPVMCSERGEKLELAIKNYVDAYLLLLIRQAEIIITEPSPDLKTEPITSAMHHIFNTLAGLQALIDNDIERKTYEKIIIVALERVRAFYRERFRGSPEIAVVYDQKIVQAAIDIGIATFEAL